MVPVVEAVRYLKVVPRAAGASVHFDALPASGFLCRRLRRAQRPHESCAIAAVIPPIRSADVPAFGGYSSALAFSRRATPVQKKNAEMETFPRPVFFRQAPPGLLGSFLENNYALAAFSPTSRPSERIQA